MKTINERKEVMFGNVAQTLTSDSKRHSFQTLFIIEYFGA